MPKTLRGGGTGGRLTQSNVRKMRRGGRGGRSCSPNQLQIIGLFCTALTGAGGDPEAPQRCNLFNFCEWHTAPHPGYGGWCDVSGDDYNTGYFNCSQFNEAQCQVASNMPSGNSPCSQNPYYSEI